MKSVIPFIVSFLIGAITVAVFGFVFILSPTSKHASEDRLRSVELQAKFDALSTTAAQLLGNTQNASAANGVASGQSRQLGAVLGDANQQSQLLEIGVGQLASQIGSSSADAKTLAGELKQDIGVIGSLLAFEPKPSQTADRLQKPGQ